MARSADLRGRGARCARLRSLRRGDRDVRAGERRGEPPAHEHLHRDLQARATAQPWAWDWNAAPAFSTTLHGALLARIRAALERA